MQKQPSGIDETIGARAHSKRGGWLVTMLAIYGKRELQHIKSSFYPPTTKEVTIWKGKAMPHRCWWTALSWTAELKPPELQSLTMLKSSMIRDDGRVKGLSPSAFFPYVPLHVSIPSPPHPSEPLHVRWRALSPRARALPQDQNVQDVKGCLSSLMTSARASVVACYLKYPSTRSPFCFSCCCMLNPPNRLPTACPFATRLWYLYDTARLK